MNKGVKNTNVRMVNPISSVIMKTVPLYPIEGGSVKLIKEGLQGTTGGVNS